MTEDLKPTEAENQAETDLENVDFGDENQDLDEKTETPQETDGPDESKIDPPKKEINQEAVQKRIDEITFEKYEEKRKREKLEEELAELRASLEKRKAAEENIEIPDLPDIYADDYAEKVRQRDEALRKSAEIEARKKLKKEQEQAKFQADFEKRQAEINQNVERMFSTASEYGISKDELTEADRKVSKFITDPELARFILSQKDSALIIKHLSSSATELEKIQQLSPLEASAYIATKVSVQAAKLKPDLTKTPDPQDLPKGKAKPKKDPFLEGVSFE